MLASRLKVEFQHIFPVRGHSYMPADRAFGRVEKFCERTTLFYYQKNITTASVKLDIFGIMTLTG